MADTYTKRLGWPLTAERAASGAAKGNPGLAAGGRVWGTSRDGSGRAVVFPDRLEGKSGGGLVPLPPEVTEAVSADDGSTVDLS